MTNAEHCTKLMKLINDMADSETIRVAILTALQETYKRGYDVAHKQYANYKEDMGR